MALGSTQPLTEMSNRNGGKGGRCVRLTTYHHSVPLSRNLGTGNLNFLEPSGPVQASNGTDLPLPVKNVSLYHCMTTGRHLLVFFVFNRCEVKFTLSSDDTEQHRKYTCY